MQLSQEKIEEIRAYMRWHDETRTIGQVKERFGITSEQAREMYDSLFDENGIILPKSQFEKPKPDGLRLKNVGLGPDLRRSKRTFRLNEISVRNDYKNGMSLHHIEKKHKIGRSTLLRILGDLHKVKKQDKTTKELIQEVSNAEWKTIKQLADEIEKSKIRVSEQAQLLFSNGLLEKKKIGKEVAYRARQVLSNASNS